MKVVKIFLIGLLVYVGIVAVFESMLGYFQPANQNTLVITTIDAKGQPHDRVLSRLNSNNLLYVAVNHWPRAWYRRALDNPNVKVDLAGEKIAYSAVPVSTDEHARVDSDNRLSLGFRILTGFPPRYFVRLDPR